MQPFVHQAILPSLSMRLRGGSGREQTNRSSKWHGSRWARVMGTYDRPFGFTGTATQRLLLTNYWQPPFRFSRNPPKPRLWFSRLQFYKRLTQINGFTPSISIIREDRNSNLTLYAYERFRVDGGFVRVF